MPGGRPLVAVIVSCIGSKLSKPICCLYDCPAIAGGTFTVSTAGVAAAADSELSDAANADPVEKYSD